MTIVWIVLTSFLGWNDTKDTTETWNVNSPPYPLRSVEIDTHEGTWMSIDISPDGKTIVFDLLGDIYKIPIDGGRAIALTSGLAWDMQPSFSPDGKSIAFTSDRGGGDNIWIMHADGTEPHAVTDEDFRLLNSPAWSADGDFVAARKHFTGSRSLGSGEIWLYHRSGGKGVQMTTKPNDQKDVGEPAFSPDGKYLYFSQDVTIGDTFQYNKDPHQGIYAIKRMDRQTGEIIVLIQGPGGAVRPTPSPDGRYLAYIRRLDYDTAIFLFDRETGETWPVFNKLDRDMQETWAIHGVYPRFDWTPDAKALIFWAAGKINRLDIQTMTYTQIPFEVKTKRKVAEALREHVDVAPDAFQVKMLRWVDISPSGDRVLFQALGHIYLRELPNGDAQRLTKQDAHFEFYPRFSPDGKSVVYTTWSDTEFGDVRIAKARPGRDGRVISSEPGHYVEPAFSPSGDKVVLRKVSGGYLRSPMYSLNPGIYLIDLKDEDMTRIRESGIRPQFGAREDQILVTDIDQTDEQKRSLVAIDLGDYDERVLVTSEMGTEFNLSPDGKWLAFNEDYQAHVMPFAEPGRAFQIGPKQKNLPITTLSTNAGYNLRWQSDSRHLVWSIGPQLFRVEVSPELFKHKVEPETLHIGFSHRYERPSGKIAYVGGRLITMNGDQVIEQGIILVEDNRIAAIGAVGDVEIPADAHQIDTNGMTIIPGIVDVHAHGAQATDGINPQQNWLHDATLAFGVTTIHDPSNDTDEIFAASELAKAGLITAPRIFSTGTILYGARMPGYTAKINSQDEARAHIARLKAVGAISVKSYNQPRRDQRQQVLAAARELGMMVVPEGGSLFQHNMTMVVDGHTGIEHSIPVARAYDDVAQLWSQTDVYYTPTLVVGYGGVWGENYWYQKTNVWEHDRLRRFVPPFVLEPRSKRREMVPDDEFNHFRNAAVCKVLSDAGVHVNIGAHGQREGLAAHWEMWMLVQGGMTPMEALRCATWNGASYLGMDSDIGSLEAGKLADFAILSGNPLSDIRNTDSVVMVSLNGHVFDAESMHELTEGGRVRAPYFWKRESATHISFPARAKTIHHAGCVCGQ